MDYRKRNIVVKHVEDVFLAIENGTALNFSGPMFIEHFKGK